MARKAVVINISVANRNELKEWKKFARACGHSGLSEMIAVKLYQKDNTFSNRIRESINPIFNSLEYFRKIQENISVSVDLIDKRLFCQESDSEVRKAAKEIIPLLLENEQTAVELASKMNYSQETIDSAIVLMRDIGLFDFKK